jgi:6,7-dimethyl-8-ribityllumazine synthase
MRPAPFIPRIALVVSEFNPEVTGGLRRGACGWLAEQGVSVAEADVIEAPGAFELPLLAQALARSGRYDGVVCLGCVIKGDTAHFEFISLGASLGLMNASLATETPIAFGVLTTYSDDQADARSRDDAANKGREAAAACFKAIQALRRIREPERSLEPSA